MQQRLCFACCAQWFRSGNHGLLFRRLPILLPTLESFPLRLLKRHDWPYLSAMGRPKGKGKAKKGKAKPKAATSAAAGQQHPGKSAVWRPGVDQVENGETLDYDPTAYDCLTAFSIDWPCLRSALLGIHLT